jgi:hypothetical protein
VKKYGIVCDLYKVPLFEAALKEAKLVYIINPGITADSRNITVMGTDKDQERIKLLCESVEGSLRARKAKNN